MTALGGGRYRVEFGVATYARCVPAFYAIKQLYFHLFPECSPSPNVLITLSIHIQFDLLVLALKSGIQIGTSRSRV